MTHHEIMSRILNLEDLIRAALEKYMDPTHYQTAEPKDLVAEHAHIERLVEEHDHFVECLQKVNI